MYLLLLNPLLQVRVYPNDNMLWGMDVDGPVMNIQSVYVGWLKNPGLLPHGVKLELDAAGLGPADYAQILSTNPFAMGRADIDPARFLVLPQSFPYEPPFDASGQPFAKKIATSNNVTISSTHTVQNQYSVSVTASAGIEIPFTASLKTAGTLQWTNTNSLGTSATSSQSAVASIGGPSFGYNGPTNVLIYWDTIYNSFMFAYPSQPPAVSGTLLNASGEAVVHKPMTLSVAGQTFQTFTNARGEYHFYGAPSGTASVAVDGHSFAVAAGAQVSKATIRLP